MSQSQELVISPSLLSKSHLFLLLLLLSVLPAALHSQAVTVTNVFQNHYRYGVPIGNQDCPAGYNIPTGQYPSTYHLERGHAIHHLDPVTPANDYWVYWAHFDSANYGVAEIAIFKSTTECGPYVLQTGISPSTNVDGGGYGFQPGGWQSRDENIFRDSDQTYNTDGTVATYASAYLYTASNSQNSIPNHTCGYANDSIAAFKMTSDYLNIDVSTSPSTNGANWVFPCAQREAPVLFRQGSSYFLIVSQAAGWYPSQGAYGVSSNPLTGWTVSPINLGNTSTYGGQTSDGVVIQGTQATTYVLAFDHLGGDDSKNPAYVGERHDTGGMTLPVILDGTAQTATLNWYPSWTVDNTTGVLTLPTLTNLAGTGTAAATVAPYTGYPASLAIDNNYSTRWSGATGGSSSFNAAAPVSGGATCPITGATATTPCNPSLVIDIGSVKPVQEIDLSWYMVKGSEPYYTFKIAYSSDKSTWSTLDFTAFAPGSGSAANNLSAVPFNVNNTYGFNFLPVNFSARYVALIQTSVVQQNTSSPFYAPGIFEMAVIQSTAPVTPQPVTVTVTPSTTSTSTSNAFNVNVSVTGPNGQPTPSGFVQLSAPSFTSETYALALGVSSFTIPAGSLTGGNQTLTVGFRSDPTSAPIYGIATTNGTASIYIDVPAAPTGLTLTQTSPGALTAAWTAAAGATSYVLNRSSDGGGTYTQIATPTTTSYLNTGLNNDSTNYCYTVASVNSAGTGSASAPVCSTATANFPVTNIAVTPTAANVLTVTYTAVANATSYIIKRSAGGGAYAQLATPTATTYSDGSLTTGTQYCYTVAAVFSTGNGSDSSPVCNTATTNFPVSGLAVTPSANLALGLTWNAVANTTGYLLKRSVAGAAYAQLATPTTNSYTNTGLTAGVNYCYTVAAVFSGGTGPDSSPACATAVNNITSITVTNFSFEAPTTTTYVYAPTGATWTMSASTTVAGSPLGSGVTTNNSAFTAGNSAAPAGTQICFLQGKGFAYQTISGLTAGQTYRITVAASQRANKNPGQYGNPFEIRVDGTTIATVMATQGTTTYTDYSATFTATATSHVIGFFGTNALANTTYPDNTVFIDNVRLTTYPAANSSSLTPQFIWVVNGTGTLVRSDEHGTTQSSALGTSSTASTVNSVAIDSTGNAWSVSPAANLINFFSKTGATATTYTDPSLNAPSAIAIDGSGKAWVANSGSSTVSTFATNGALFSSTTDSGISAASSIAIDLSGSVWITSNTTNTLNQILGGAYPVAPLSTATTNNAPATKP